MSAAAAKDEFARFDLHDKHAKFHFNKPLWQGEALREKNLLIWADMGVGDTFKFATLIDELPRDGQITLLTQGKMVQFLTTILPFIDIKPLPRRINVAKGPNEDVTFEAINEDFDYHMPLAGLYTLLRPDLDAFSSRTRAYRLNEDHIRPYARLDILSDSDMTHVGIAWSSKNRDAKVERNYLSLEDLLPILTNARLHIL